MKVNFVFNSSITTKDNGQPAYTLITRYDQNTRKVVFRVNFQDGYQIKNFKVKKLELPITEFLRNHSCDAGTLYGNDTGYLMNVLIFGVNTVVHWSDIQQCHSIGDIMQTINRMVLENIADISSWEFSQSYGPYQQLQLFQLDTDNMQWYVSPEKFSDNQATLWNYFQMNLTQEFRSLFRTYEYCQNEPDFWQTGPYLFPYKGQSYNYGMYASRIYLGKDKSCWPLNVKLTSNIGRKVLNKQYIINSDESQGETIGIFKQTVTNPNSNPYQHITNTQCSNQMEQVFEINEHSSPLEFLEFNIQHKPLPSDYNNYTNNIDSLWMDYFYKCKTDQEIYNQIKYDPVIIELELEIE
jgi:hypothetical protein